MINYVERLRVGRGLRLYAAITGIVVFSIFALTVVGNHGGLHVQIDDSKHRARIPLSLLIGIGGYCATVFATVVGASISTDRRTPLVWTRPISRVRLVFSYLVADVAGIVIAFTFALVILILVPIGLFGLLRFVTVDASIGSVTLMFGGVALMWYGVLQAITAWFRGPGGAICGISWGAFVTLIAFAHVRLPEPFHTAILALNVVNPLAYVSSLQFTTGDDRATLVSATSIFSLGQGWATLAMYAIALVGIVVAVVGWKRAEL